MNRRAVAEAKRAWRAAVAAREKAEDAFARAEVAAERAYHGWEQWDARRAAHEAHARLEEAKEQESTTESEYLRLLPHAQALIARAGR